MENRAPTKAEILVKELKLAVQDLVDVNSDFAEDYYLLRWLKARSMNVKKAETAIRDAVKWRQTTLQDLFSLPMPSELVDLIARHTPKGRCRNGGLMEYIEFGDVQLKSIVRQYGKDLYRSYTMNELLNAEKENSRWDKQVFLNNGIGKEIPLTEDSVSGNVLVVDLGGLVVKDVMSVRCIQLLYQLLYDAKAYFPPHARAVIIINAPTYAMHVIRFIQTLAENLIDLQVYDRNRESWIEALLRYADETSIPEMYGGKMEINKETRFRW